MDFKEWVESLFKEHRNPTVKFDIKKNKLFSTKPNHREDEQVEERVECLKQVLQCERVERRCARNQLLWLPERRLLKMQKRQGAKTMFMGFENKTGMYLYPEEGMFLLETNRAEITWNSVPINMDRAFSTLLDGKQTLDAYKAYKKLLLKGFTLKRNKERANKESANPRKKVKLDNAVSLEIAIPEYPTEFKDVFAKLQLRGPRCSKELVEKDSDYKMTQVLDGCRREFNLSFMFTDVLDPQIACYPGDSNIYCSVDNDVLFSKFTSAELPALI